MTGAICRSENRFVDMLLAVDVPRLDVEQDRPFDFCPDIEGRQAVSAGRGSFSIT